MDPSEKRPFIQRLFSRIAPRYDWYNRLVSCGLDRGWRRRALAQGGIGATQRILDVCAGTGDLALACAARQQGQGTVIGVDMTGPMLTIAQRKQRAAGVDVHWVQADAQALPFAGGTFDRVVIGFSTRNLSDLSLGLREMVRVLRSGGRLIILETGYPSNPIVRFGYLLYLFTVARVIGWLLTGQLWPFTYLAKSVRGFLTPAQFIKRLQDAGTSVEYVPLSGGLASLYVATKSDPSGSQSRRATMSRSVDVVGQHV